MTSTRDEALPQKQKLENKAEWSRRDFVTAIAAITAAAGAKVEALAARRREVVFVPNFHPASCGWLANFSKERIYCANTYLTHLDRVRDDPNYACAVGD